jgi:hypothetical protein
MIVISILKRASNPQAEVGIAKNHGLQFLAACSRPGKARSRWGSGATGSTATHAPSPRLCCTLYYKPNCFEEAILCGIKWANLGNLCVTSYFGVRAKMCDLFPGRARALASKAIPRKSSPSRGRERHRDRPWGGSCFPLQPDPSMAPVLAANDGRAGSLDSLSPAKRPGHCRNGTSSSFSSNPAEVCPRTGFR